MTQTFKTKIQAVEAYLKKGGSLRKISRAFKIPHKTIHRWVKWYKEIGKENLEKKVFSYKKPWNKILTETEKKIVLLKEQCPSITVRKAKVLLDGAGIKTSFQGIWVIWKKYGYAGFKKGENEPTSKISERLSNIKRQMEAITSSFEKIPLHLYLKKQYKLYRKCKKRKLNYLALKVGINEVIASVWNGKPEKALERIEELKKIIKKGKNYNSYFLLKPKFTLHVLEGIAYTLLLEIKRAKEIARTCKELLERQKSKDPYLMDELGILYIELENYREAEYWFSNTLNKVDERTNKRVKARLAYISLMKGEYKKAMSISQDAKLVEWAQSYWKLFFDSTLFLIKGMPQKAIAFSLSALSCAKKGELNIGIYNAYFAVASAYASLGEKIKARRILLKLVPFLEKNKLKREKITIEVLVDKKMARTVANQTKAEKILPTFKMGSLLKSKNYFKALSYAKKMYLLTHFYFYLFFFPESVINLLEKGKNTELPKTILQLPVFNKDAPIYNIKFLGDLIVEKNGNYIRAKLKPKDKAFLIHLALRLETPGKEIPLENLYENFWRDKSNPRSNLSHMLLRIKQALKIPTHLLEINSKEGVLRNKGIYWTTDYLEYEQALANRKAFLQGGEWKFAEKEFLTAFTLMRGAPFERMYDNWSDEKRIAILNQYENEIAKFAKECFARKGQGLAKKVLKKAERVMNVKLQSSNNK